MKHMLSLILLALIYVGIASVISATVGSIGYGLYLWGSVGTALSVAAWTAFTLWLKMFFGGIVAILAAFTGLHFLDK